MVRFSLLLVFVICASTNAWLFDDSFIKECKKNGAFKMAYLIEMAQAEKVMEKLGPVTFFAIRDDFFPHHLFHRIARNITLVGEVLKYHLVKGCYRSENLENELVLTSFNRDLTVRANVYKHKKQHFPLVTVNGARVLSFNHQVKRKNGVIHIVDKILFPAHRDSILDEIAQSSQYSTLLYAMTKAGFSDELSDGTYTLFAPTNDAFQRLPLGMYDYMVRNQTCMRNLLGYHLVKGTVYSTSINDCDKLKTVNKGYLKFYRRKGCLTIRNQAKVTKADLGVTNGVIHVIDSVLIPPGMTWK